MLVHPCLCVQLNDTHPTIAVPELMRILMDENKLGWTRSWAICCKASAACGVVPCRAATGGSVLRGCMHERHKASRDASKTAATEAACMNSDAV